MNDADKRDTRGALTQSLLRRHRLLPVLYVCAIGFAFVSPVISDVLFVAVAVIWILPDRRFEPAWSDPADSRQ